MATGLPQPMGLPTLLGSPMRMTSQQPMHGIAALPPPMGPPQPMGPPPPRGVATTHRSVDVHGIAAVHGIGAVPGIAVIAFDQLIAATVDIAGAHGIAAATLLSFSGRLPPVQMHAAQQSKPSRLGSLVTSSREPQKCKSRDHCRRWCVLRQLSAERTTVVARDLRHRQPAIWAARVGRTSEVGAATAADASAVVCDKG